MYYCSLLSTSKLGTSNAKVAGGRQNICLLKLLFRKIKQIKKKKKTKQKRTNKQYKKIETKPNAQQLYKENVENLPQICLRTSYQLSRYI